MQTEQTQTFSFVSFFGIAEDDCRPLFLNDLQEPTHCTEAQTDKAKRSITAVIRDCADGYTGVSIRADLSRHRQ